MQVGNLTLHKVLSFKKVNEIVVYKRKRKKIINFAHSRRTARSNQNIIFLIENLIPSLTNQTLALIILAKMKDNYDV